MGVGAAGVGVNLPDPYLGSTLVGAVLPVLAGVIVPLDACPAWLRALSAAAPVSGTVGALDGSGAGGLARDLLAAAVWAGVGLAVTRRAVSALRDGRRYDVV